MNQELNKSTIAKIKDWQDQIDQLRFENNKLRDALAQVIRREVSTAFLEEAEHFNHKFMEMDQIIELMRHEIVSLPLVTAEIAPEKAGALFVRFIKDLERCEKEFHILETSFLKRLNNFSH